MTVNPMNVINLLHETFQAMSIPKSITNYEERRLAENFKNILLNAMKDYSGVEIVEDNSLYFEEPYKNCEMEVIEDEESESEITELDLSHDVCSEDDNLSHEYKLRAVEYWHSGKKKFEPR